MNQNADVRGDRERFHKIFLLSLVAGITVLFLLVIRSLLMVLVLAALFSAVLHPIYRKIQRRLGGRKAPASILTILLALLLIIVPLVALLGIVADQAVQVSRKISETVVPWVQQHIEQPRDIGGILEKLPFYEQLLPYRARIMEKVGEWAGQVGSWGIGAISSAARGTFSFFFSLVIMLYAMFFFLMDGPAMLHKAYSYLPLAESDKKRMSANFVSVTRATLKGTLLIGIVQGFLGGIGYAFLGLHDAVFWGTVMAVLSMIPVIGTPLVWIPAAVYLFVQGRIVAAVVLVAWGGIVISSVDNFLRPVLVGKDLKMPDLMIMVSTLGGLFLFGPVGFILGPLVAALFLTILDLYGTAFQAELSVSHSNAPASRSRGSRRRRRRPRKPRSEPSSGKKPGDSSRGPEPADPGRRADGPAAAPGR